MLAASKYQFLLAIGTFFLVISLISLTVISLAPKDKSVKTTTSSNEGPQSVGLVEAPPAPKDNKNEGATKNGGANPPITAKPVEKEPEEKEKNKEPEKKTVTNPAEKKPSTGPAENKPPATSGGGGGGSEISTTNDEESESDNDDPEISSGSGSSSGSKPPPITTGKTPSSSSSSDKKSTLKSAETPVKLVFTDLSVLKNPKKSLKCGSFTISGFADKHVIKVFFGVDIANDFETNIEKAIQAKPTEFNIDDHIKDLKVEPINGEGVIISHTKCAKEVSSTLTSSFAEFYDSVSNEFPEGFFVVLEGPQEKVNKYVLGEKWPEPVAIETKVVETPDTKLQVVKYQPIRIMDVLKRSWRYFGRCDVSGFDDNKIKRIFISVTYANFADYDKIYEAFEGKTSKEFDAAYDFGQMQKNAEDDKGIAFEYSTYDVLKKDHKYDKIKSDGFIKFFQELRDDKDEGSHLGGKNFFVILTGTEASLQDFTLKTGKEDKLA